LDISSFGLEVIATGAWFARGDEGAVRGLLATAIMLLFMKTMYFARGFPLWGPLVRMLVNIVDDMRPFVLSKPLFGGLPCNLILHEHTCVPSVCAIAPFLCNNYHRSYFMVSTQSQDWC